MGGAQKQHMGRSESEVKMAETKNYKLKKPEGNEYANIEDINNNMDKIDDALDGKVDKKAGKGLSTNDYNDTDKNKVANVPDNTTTELAQKAVTINKTATLGTSWTAATGYVQQVVTVQGILATDTPIIDIITTTADFKAQQEAWGNVFKAQAGANQITFYAKEATETSISLNIKVVR